MKENTFQQFIGQTIVTVRYFEINRENHEYFFEDFDNFDLGLEILFSNDSRFHIGWKYNDRPELGFGIYEPQRYYEKFYSIDATDKWSKFQDSPIVDIEVIYVSEEWKIPAKCTIHFENQASISIVLGQELNNDFSIPTPLMYDDGCEFYVFHTSDIPEIEYVRMIMPAEYVELDDAEEEYVYKEKFSGCTIPVMLMIGFILLALYLIISHFFFN